MRYYIAGAIFATVLMGVMSVVAPRPSTSKTYYVAPPVGLTGQFEGHGAITLQCLWEPVAKGDLHDGPPTDFFTLGDSGDLVFMAVSDHHEYLLSGHKCVYSVDFTGIPQKEPPK